jgi:glutamyl-tRNA(Gln) amidotransferase subunit D
MLPETAFAKLSWILGQTEDVEEAKRLFRENLAYETSKRTEYITYPGAMWWEHAIRTPAQG